MWKGGPRFRPVACEGKESEAGASRGTLQAKSVHFPDVRRLGIVDMISPGSISEAYPSSRLWSESLSVGNPPGGRRWSSS